jgi:Holliday junction resolvasome RuvABC endonuclease subunit
MNNSTQKQVRILAIAPSSRGFGYAVLESPETLVDWGVKSVRGDKNTESLEKVDELILLYQPGVIALEDTKGSRRSARIQILSQIIMALTANRNVRSVLLSRDRVRRVFFSKGQGTKFEVAEILARKFPDELGCRLPRERRPWMSEDYRMDIFDAVSLALTFAYSNKRATPGALLV